MIQTSNDFIPALRWVDNPAHWTASIKPFVLTTTMLRKDVSFHKMFVTIFPTSMLMTDNEDISWVKNMSTNLRCCQKLVGDRLEMLVTDSKW